jgi:hypothetical protein
LAGTLPFNATSDLCLLTDFAEEACPGVGTIIADSAKDLASGVLDDKVGSALNAAWQEA